MPKLKNKPFIEIELSSRVIHHDPTPKGGQIYDFYIESLGSDWFMDEKSYDSFAMDLIQEFVENAEEDYWKKWDEVDDILKKDAEAFEGFDFLFDIEDPDLMIHTVLYFYNFMKDLP